MKRKTYSFQESEYIKATVKLNSRLSRLRLSNEDEQTIIKIANKL